MNRARTSSVAIIHGAVGFVVTMALVRTRALPRWTGVVGGAAGISVLGMLLVGAIGVDVHDFGLFAFAYSAWAILIGLQLWRQAPTQPASQ